MSMNLKHFVEWVNRCGEELCELYDMFLEETNTSQYDVSILDFQLICIKTQKTISTTTEVIRQEVKNEMGRCDGRCKRIV